jgi:hypothetical protein
MLLTHPMHHPMSFQCQSPLVTQPQAWQSTSPHQGEAAMTHVLIGKIIDTDVLGWIGIVVFGLLSHPIFNLRGIKQLIVFLNHLIFNLGASSGS